MRKVILFVLNILRRLGAMQKISLVRYSGQGFSMNALYAQGHWSARNKIKNQYGDKFNTLLQESDVEDMQEFSLICFYNSAHDVDNISGMTKVFVDVMTGGNGKKAEKRYRAYVADDSKRYYKFLGICPDNALAANTFEFLVIKHS